jgi:hypothetical protein
VDIHTRLVRRTAIGRFSLWVLLLTLTSGLGLSTLGARRAFDAPPVPRTASAAETTIVKRDLRSSLEFLASDALAGRGVSHPGNEAAVSYLASMLERFGVGQPTDQGFLQPVPLVSSTLGTDTRLDQLSADGTVDRSWTAGDDFYPVPESPDGDFSAALVYVGFGITDAKAGRDDLRSQDVRDRVIVMLDREPGDRGLRDGTSSRRSRRNLPSTSAPEDAIDSLEVRARHAAERGARALIVVSRDRRLRSFGSLWPDSPSIQRATYHLADSQLPLPTVRLSAAAASHLLDLDRAGSPARSVTSLYEKPGLRLDLSDRRVHLKVDIANRAVNAPNVLGFVEGRDPQHRSELVIISAHLDHDGLDEDGRIYNGADDDASGMSAVLEVADAFATAVRNGQAPRRSVLFAFWNAEEKGLLGSKHYIKHIVPDAHRVLAGVHLDMVGRHEIVPSSTDPRFRGLPVRSESETRSWVHLLGYSFSPDLAGLVKEEASRLGLSARTEYDGNPIDLLRRSDHWSFLTAGVPVLFFTTGLHPDYHTPQDDVGEIDFDKLERITRLTFRVAWRLADADASPRFTGATAEP